MLCRFYEEKRREQRYVLNGEKAGVEICDLINGEEIL